MVRQYICKHCGKELSNPLATRAHMEFAHNKKVLLEFISNHFDTVENKHG